MPELTTRKISRILDIYFCFHIFPLERFQIQNVNVLRKLIRFFFIATKDKHAIIDDACRMAISCTRYNSRNLWLRPQMSGSINAKHPKWTPRDFNIEVQKEKKIRKFVGYQIILHYSWMPISLVRDLVIQPNWVFLLSHQPTLSIKVGVWVRNIIGSLTFQLFGRWYFPCHWSFTFLANWFWQIRWTT